MSSPLYTGLVINQRYELLSQLGEGGSGSVFKARQIDTERLVALKFLHGSQVTDKASMARFTREGNVLSRFTHTHIPTFYEFGIWNEQLPYIAMEFLEGKSLRSVIDETGGISWTRCLYIITQICDAMESAHQSGIVHRDLKPNNIMLMTSPSADFVQVVDFGLAKLAQENQEKTITETGLLIGSIFYMSPELCLAKRADSRSDIYSLGCILYEALTGKLPLEADTPIAMMQKHVHEMPAPVSTLVADRSMPSAMDAIVERAMAKQPAQRYQSMKEFADDLRLVSAGEGRVTGAVTLRNLHRTRRHFRGTMVAVSATVLALCSLWFLTDDATCFILSLRFQGKNRTDALFAQSKELFKHGRKGAAIKVLELIGDQADRRVDRAAALTELSEQYSKDGKKELSVRFAERALVSLAKAAKRTLRSDEQTNSTLARLLVRDLQLLTEAGQSLIFDYSLPNHRQAETNSALIVLDSYFRGLDRYPEVVWAVKHFEKKAIDEIALQSTSMAEEFYSEYALACFQCGKFKEGSDAVRVVIAGAKRGVYPTLRTTASTIALTEFLVSDACGTDEKGVYSQQAKDLARKLLGFLTPVLTSNEWFLLQQVEPATVLNGHQKIARINLSLKNYDEAHTQLESTVKVAEGINLSDESILAVCKVYGDLVKIDMNRANYAAAEASLNKGRAFLANTFTQASARAQPERAATAELCKAQLIVWSGDLNLERKNFAAAEADYREGFAAMTSMAGTLNEWLGRSRLTPQLRKALEQARERADQLILETSTKFHDMLVAQKRANDAIAFHRLAIAGLREIGRFKVCGILYGQLVEAMVIDGRYSHLDAMLQECQKAAVAGPGMYEPKVRFNILLDAAQAYASIDEYSRSLSILETARSNFSKSIDREQLIRLELMTGKVLRDAGDKKQAKVHFLKADSLAEDNHSVYRRQLKFAMAELALSDCDQLEATRNSQLMLQLPPSNNEDTAAEAAFASAVTDNRYTQAIAMIANIEPNTCLRRLERYRLICELAKALNHESQRKSFLNERQDLLKTVLGPKHPAIANSSARPPGW